MTAPVPNPNRTASSPATGARRGGVVGTIAGVATVAAATQVPDPYKEVSAMAVGAFVTGALTALGKWARNKGGSWGAFLGWLV